ncbi:MAG: hypothetical protein Q8Q33_10190 [Chlamydiota bacterium]|nr:hypothetical protein [Chlamydiota bacterium]
MNKSLIRSLTALVFIFSVSLTFTYPGELSGEVKKIINDASELDKLLLDYKDLIDMGQVEQAKHLNYKLVRYINVLTRLKDLEKQIDALESKSEEEKTESDTLQKTISGLKSDSENIRLELSSYKTKLSNAQSELERLRSSSHSDQTQMRDIQSKLYSCQSSLRTLETSYNDCRMEVEQFSQPSDESTQLQ